MGQGSFLPFLLDFLILGKGLGIPPVTNPLSHQRETETERVEGHKASWSLNPEGFLL